MSACEYPAKRHQTPSEQGTLIHCPHSRTLFMLGLHRAPVAFDIPRRPTLKCVYNENATAQIHLCRHCNGTIFTRHLSYLQPISIPISVHLKPRRKRLKSPSVHGIFNLDELATHRLCHRCLALHPQSLTAFAQGAVSPPTQCVLEAPCAAQLHGRSRRAPLGSTAPA